MIWMFKVYRQSIKNNFSAFAAYRLNFIFTVTVNLLRDMLLPLITILIYSVGLSFPQWGFYEALLIQAVFLMCTGFAQAFVFGLVDTVMQSVREGTFDLVLLKPGNSSFLAMVMSFDITNIYTFIAGLIFFVYSIKHLEAPSFLDWIQFIFLFLMGMSVLVGCSLFMAATAFKWVGNGRIFQIFDSITMFGRYPATIYPKWAQSFIAFVIPVAMLGFFPATALLGRLPYTAYLAVIPCGIFLAAGFFVFNAMVYNYSSAGG